MPTILASFLRGTRWVASAILLTLWGLFAQPADIIIENGGIYTVNPKQPVGLLTESIVSVPPSHWTAVKLDVPQHRTTVHVFFQVEGGGSRVQAIVLSRSEAERFNRGRSIQPLFMSGFEKSDNFHVFVPDAGEYVLLLDNRLEGRFPTNVKLRLQMSLPNDARVQTIPPERRAAVVALSLLFFGAVVVFSAAKFLRSA